MKINHFLMFSIGLAAVASTPIASMKEEEPPAYFKDLEATIKKASPTELFLYFKFLTINLTARLLDSDEFVPAIKVSSNLYALQEAAFKFIHPDAEEERKPMNAFARLCGYPELTEKDEEDIKDFCSRSFLSLLPEEARPVIETQKKNLMEQLKIEKWDDLSPAEKSIHGLTAYLRAHDTILPALERLGKKIEADKTKLTEECAKRGYDSPEAILKAARAELLNPEEIAALEEEEEAMESFGLIGLDPSDSESESEQ